MNDRERAICARVKQFREDIQWSQLSFSEGLRISRHQLANVEYGRAPLRVILGLNICDVFNANGEWLVTGHGLMHGGNPMLTAVKFGPEWYSLLFSEAYDQSPDVFTPPSYAPTYLSETPTPNFDPQAYLIKEILLWFQLNKFKSPLESENFAREISGYAETYLTQLRSMGTAIKSVRSENKIQIESKSILDIRGQPANLADMRSEVPTWPELKEDIKMMTAERGAKKALADEIKVSRQVLGNWLSDDAQGAPNADLTLELLKLVKQWKRKNKKARRVRSTASADPK
jgi:transcriptional regulator with XRE-family HTH domain